MIRIIVAGILGGVVYFIWGAIAWMVLGLHDSSMKTIPNEEQVVAAVKSGVTEPGFYTFPEVPHDANASAEAQTAAEEEWLARHKAGPIGILICYPNGADPMNPSIFLGGFLIGLAACSVSAWLLAQAAPQMCCYGQRALFVALLGLFAGIVVDGANWNWWHYPDHYTLLAIVDHVIGWFLVGLVQAAVIRPIKSELVAIST